MIKNRNMSNFLNGLNTPLEYTKYNAFKEFTRKEYVCIFTQIAVPKDLNKFSNRPKFCQFKIIDKISQNLKLLAKFISNMTSPSSENCNLPESELVFSAISKFIELPSIEKAKNIKKLQTSEIPEEKYAYYILKRTNHRNHYLMR